MINNSARYIKYFAENATPEQRAEADNYNGFAKILFMICTAMQSIYNKSESAKRAL
jgi:hypothetical protein